MIENKWILDRESIVWETIKEDGIDLLFLERIEYG